MIFFFPFLRKRIELRNTTSARQTNWTRNALRGRSAVGLGKRWFSCLFVSVRVYVCVYITVFFVCSGDGPCCRGEPRCSPPFWRRRQQGHDFIVVISYCNLASSATDQRLSTCGASRQPSSRVRGALAAAAVSVPIFEFVPNMAHYFLVVTQNNNPCRIHFDSILVNCALPCKLPWTSNYLSPFLSNVRTGFFLPTWNYLQNLMSFYYYLSVQSWKSLHSIENWKHFAIVHNYIGKFIEVVCRL